MTGTLLYTVQCTFEDPTVARDWSRWLFDEHFDDLRTCGALSCELVRVDAPGTVLQARYRFADRSAFDAYVAEHADRRVYLRDFAVVGASMGIDPDEASVSGNDDPDDWCDQWDSLAFGDGGSPGRENDWCW